MKASKKLLILSSTLISTSLPIVTSISCTVKTIAQIKYEKMLEKVNKKIDTLLEKMNNNISQKALIEVQKKSFDQLKNKTYENDEEYKKATTQLQLILDALELIA